MKPTVVKDMDLNECKISKLNNLKFYVKQSKSKLYHWIASTKNAKSIPEKVVEKETEFATPDKHVVSEQSVNSNKVNPPNGSEISDNTHNVKSFEFEVSENENLKFDDYLNVSSDKVKQTECAWVSWFH